MGRGRSGEEFSARPVKHVLSVLSSLQTCRNGADCTCPSWHPEPDQTHDAVLDVFRRQFFNDPGRPVKWDKASHFAVLFRYVKCLETQVLCASGQHGVLLSPRQKMLPGLMKTFRWSGSLNWTSVLWPTRPHVKWSVWEWPGQARDWNSSPCQACPEGLHYHQARCSSPCPGSRTTFHCGP